MTFTLPPADSVHQTDIPAALVALNALQGQLAARLLAAPASHPVDDDLLTTVAAAEFLHCSPKWLYRHAKQLSAIRRGREYLWSRKALDRYCARQRA